MSEYSFIGKRIPKPDARFKVAGAAVYASDLKLPGMLHGAILRSLYPHAEILSINTEKAEKLPGVKAVITAEGTPKIPFGYGKDNYPLKFGRVKCLSDEIAAAAADNEIIARQAVSLIEVKYKELPAVFDPFDAMKEGAPLLHQASPNNLSTRYFYDYGDVQKGFAEADLIAEGRFELPFQAHCCLGTCACVAEWTMDGRLTMHSPTQVPFLYQKDMADVLGIKGSRIRVIQPTIGGGFGSKLDLYPYEIIAALLAKATGKPVKIEYSREEEFRYSPPRPPMVIDMKTGAARDGRLTAREARLVCDNGAYNSWGSVTPIISMQTVSSLYRVPNIKFESLVVYTNNPYGSAMRGFGNPEATFAVETQMDELAEMLGMDPLEFRLKNSNQPGDVTPQKMEITSCGLPECLKEAAARIGLGKKRARTGTKARGTGIASGLHVGGGARIYRSDGCGCYVKVDDFGHVTLVTGSTEIGQGSDAVLTQMVAEVLAVPVQDVTIKNEDTDTSPWDVGVHASRTTFIAGNAAVKAAQDAKRQIMEAAAEMTGAPVESLDLKNGQVYLIDDPSKTLPVGKVIRARHFREHGDFIIGKFFYDPPTHMQDKHWDGNISAAYGFGTQSAEVEIDLETGQVKVLKIVAAHDVGRVINPMTLEGQIDGGIAQGIGYGLYETIQLEKGRVQNPNFADYKILTAADMPEIEPVLIETIDPEGPFGAKGVGEMPMVPTAAAIANAIYDAVGVRMRSLPITPEKILKALKVKQKTLTT